MAFILLVDDDPQGLESTRKILELSGYEIAVAEDGRAALDRLGNGGEKPVDLVVSDVRMPRLSGIDFLRAISLRGDGVPVILMTAFGRVEDAVWAMKLGAVDFLTKPFKRQALLAAVEAALRRARGVVAAAGKAPDAGDEADPASSSRASADLRDLIRRIAPTTATVLLTGESGTGKERAAKLIHRLSARSEGSFIALNCASLPESLIESELFGFEKGSFTGASGAKAGLFEAANGGTLLLDEIGDMPLAVQASLLRVLQEGETRRVGAVAARKVDVRVIAATHRDLRRAVSEGRFREDLLFRLEVISVRVPPLRERMEDLPALASQFASLSARRHGKSAEGISPEAMALLLAHPWPGNVRELANVVERAVVLSTTSRIEAADLPPHLSSRELREAARVALASEPAISVRIGTPLKDVEELLIRKTLEATEGDKAMTARLLGINSRTIYRKLSQGE